jgi:hypothetical protein
MPHRLIIRDTLLEYWPYLTSWLLLTMQWVTLMPDWLYKLLLSVGTGMGVAFGKWLIEKALKKLDL